MVMSKAVYESCGGDEMMIVLNELKDLLADAIATSK